MKMVCRDEMLVKYVEELKKSFKYVNYVFSYEYQKWIIVVK